jgi:hypothetical protein
MVLVCEGKYPGISGQIKYEYVITKEAHPDFAMRFRCWLLAGRD